MIQQGMTYAAAGVRETGDVLGGLLHWVKRTLPLRQGIGESRVGLGHYASVIDIGRGMGVAISTDGVGSKILIAEQMGRYDTIGIDCVAMNVNDVLCVGAEPLAMVDYVAVQVARSDVLEEIGRGLYEGARRARITIPGGELAQLPEIIRGHAEESGIDLAGTAIGLAPLDRLILGREVRPGDALLGLESSGIHSNGLTLARRVFLETAGWSLDRRVPELGRALGEELLEPTRIYVPEVMAMLEAGLPIRALAHITSGGFLNLERIEAEQDGPVPVGYAIDFLPEPPPIFSLIQRLGAVPDEEMYRVFNMGIGFCLVLPESAVDAAARIAADHGTPCHRLGTIVPDPARQVLLRPRGLIGRDGAFHRGS